MNWKGPFGQAVLRGASEALLNQTRATLEKLHPATLVRRGRAPGLSLEPDWKTAPLEKPLVIVVHGFYSNNDRAERLLVDVAKAGFAVGRFEYASDRAIEESARLLAADLRRVACEQPERCIALVTHSMGGIVARAVVEDPELDPGNVSRLVMVAPPNHGSALADVGYEARPAVDSEEAEGHMAAAGRSALVALLGPAGEQLRTNSPFLRKLNSRPRNPQVRYTIILGTKAPFTTASFQVAQAAADEAEHRWRWTRWIGEAVKSRFAAMEELQQGRGDGVVSVASGRLDGVEDVVLLPFHHNEPLWSPTHETVQQLYREVLDRLEDRDK